MHLLPCLPQVRPDSLERKLEALQQQLYITPQQVRAAGCSRGAPAHDFMS
jgi:hypothetical protein